MNDYHHRCTDKECPFVGQKTSKSCGCHIPERDMMLARIAALEAALDCPEHIDGHYCQRCETTVACSSHIKICEQPKG